MTVDVETVVDKDVAIIEVTMDEVVGIDMVDNVVDEEAGIRMLERVLLARVVWVVADADAASAVLDDVVAIEEATTIVELARVVGLCIVKEEELDVVVTAEDDVDVELGTTLVELDPVSVETELLPVGTSPALTHPVLAVKAAGHVTCTKSTVGLSAPSNQSNLQSQPG